MQNWLVTVCLATILIGFVYATAQHILRMDANEPQVQMADDLAAALNTDDDRTFHAVMPRRQVNPETSLAPFVIVYDNNYKLVKSCSCMSGDIPQIPKGVLDNVKKRGEERLTWEPKKGVRIATVVKKYNDGFVVVGRNLRETERTIDEITLLAASAALASWIVLTIPLLLNPLKRKSRKK